MNEIKELLIDLKLYYFFLLIKIYNRFINFTIFKFNNIINTLNAFTYSYFFYCLKSSIIFRMDTLSDLTTINYQGSLYEFELVYITLSYKYNIRFISKLYIKKEDLILSLSNIYINSNWLEREIWDLFGIKFLYHKDLRRILTDYGFIGHPLLKIFPLIGFIELRYDDSLNKIIKEMVEFAQSFRVFNYYNPWIN